MSYICRKQVSCSFDYLTRSAANLSYNYCLLGFEFVLPVSMIVVCYAGIVVSVRRQGGDLTIIQSSHSAQETVTNRMQREKRRQECNLAKVMICICLSSTIASVSSSSLCILLKISDKKIV